MARALVLAILAGLASAGCVAAASYALGATRVWPGCLLGFSLTAMQFFAVLSRRGSR